MGAPTQQQVPVGPASQNDQDSLQVRGSSQQMASSSHFGQHASYVPPHPNIQATQTFFDAAPAPVAAPPPMPAVQGCSVGAINTTQPLYCPAQQVQLFMRQLTEQAVTLNQPVKLTFDLCSP